MFPIEIGIWQALILCGLFGVCAVWNRTKGWQKGCVFTLERLEQMKIIRIEANKIVPGVGKELTK